MAWPSAGGSRRLLTMLPSVCGVLGVAPQRRQHLLVSVGKPHALDDQVLAVLLRQAIRHPQPQGQRAIIANGWPRTVGIPLVSSRLPSTKNSLLRASCQSC